MVDYTNESENARIENNLSTIAEVVKLTIFSLSKNAEIEIEQITELDNGKFFSEITIENQNIVSIEYLICVLNKFYTPEKIREGIDFLKKKGEIWQLNEKVIGII